MPDKTGLSDIDAIAILDAWASWAEGPSAFGENVIVFVHHAVKLCLCDPYSGHNCLLSPISRRATVSAFGQAFPRVRSETVDDETLQRSATVRTPYSRQHLMTFTASCLTSSWASSLTPVSVNGQPG
ncbi:hypothetical protein FRC0337_01610 [Corynebacterium diphtheriae]|nr:hypothetical protein CIP101841_01722 [Corynebacterium diphtheriae]CAB0852712.1 hypothetical protein FRC0337_01610 [Corynebacterium diphtheriae]CAB1020617.1 hypothetical protein FRC0515_01758 [Corynebacterium diphtheriae]CAB1045009.1 hypothetical protein FRC0547_01818 [Corynebacterium diphtheriae]